VLELAIQSDAGGRRTNRDASGHTTVGSGELLFAIAQGPHGPENGDGSAATRMAVAATLQGYEAGPVAWGPARRLRAAVQQANPTLYERARFGTAGARALPTIIAAVVSENVLWAVHVGSSRLYLVREDLVSQLSTDPTPMAASPANVLDLPRSVASAALGRTPTPLLDRFSLRLFTGDRLVACTEGLHSLLHEEEIRDFCQDRTAADACRTFLKVAKRRGPTDDLTVAVLLVQDGGVPHRSGAWPSRLARALGFRG